MENIELAYALTNQYLFQEAKNNIQDLGYYFSVHPSCSGNRLIEGIINAVKEYDLASMDLPLFQSIIAKSGKTDAEASKILDDIRRWKSYSKEQIEPARKYLQDVVASVVIQKANRMYQDHPSDYLKYLKNVSFKTGDLDTFSPKSFAEFDINSIIAESNESVIKTPFEWLNKSFEPFDGMPKAQMCLVCAPPGVGKSLFSMYLASYMASIGNKVLYIALGDLSQKDFLTRIGAITLDMSFADTHRNLGTVYNTLRQIMGDNLDISISPAGVVSAEDIVEYVENSEKDYDVVIVDYDSNCKGATDGDSMYQSYGKIYETLNRLVLDGKLLFICTQPKISAWDKQVVDLQDVGESSRKQHTGDCIIGIGREINSPNHLHTIKISKSRRGEVGVIAYTIRLDNGRFIEIPKGLYDSLKQVQEKRHYTSADITGMISQYNAQLSQINNQVKQNMNSHQTNLNNNQGPAQHLDPLAGGPNPFSNKP